MLDPAGHGLSGPGGQPFRRPLPGGSAFLPAAADDRAPGRPRAQPASSDSRSWQRGLHPARRRASRMMVESESDARTCNMTELASRELSSNVFGIISSLLSLVTLV